MPTASESSGESTSPTAAAGDTHARSIQGSPTHPRIGIFDSGVGGLSVLRSLQAALPRASLTYIADSANAPYGERDDDFVVHRSELLAAWLVAAGAQLLVVACNTATAAAVHRLRATWPSMPIVGVEPGLKPAVAASVNRRIGVLATPSTLRSGKFQRLLEQHTLNAQVHLQPCPGLAALIEQGELHAPALTAMVETYCTPLRVAGVDAVVLGCTHYAFISELIGAAMGGSVRLIDTAEAVARHAANLAGKRDPGDGRNIELDSLPGTTGSVRLVTTGSAELLQRVAASWLGLQCEVEAHRI